MQSAPKTASRKGPTKLVRFRSKSEIEMVKRAARLLNLTANTFMAEALVRQASEVFQSQKQEVRAE
jgi:uncharacterized protein (DUF1778 family)